MRFYALVEDWPAESMAFFRELPGCFSSAPTYEEAVKVAPEAISAFLKWSKENDLVLVEEYDGEIEVVVKEQLPAAIDEIGPLFKADLPPPDDTEIEHALNVAAVARAALLELYDEVPEELRKRSTSPDAWSLTQHLHHILEAEAWYMSRLTEYPTATFGNALAPDLSMALFENAMDYELILRGLTSEVRERVFTHDGEDWTAAKVLRRMTGHLREHYPWMVEIARDLGTS
jgi:predicted RNase H-like HicB family nuclease